MMNLARILLLLACAASAACARPAAADPEPRKGLAGPVAAPT